jgi:hypothetical protein
MSLILVFNKNLPWAHTELELDMLGVHGKLVKYVVHSSKRKVWKKKKNSSHKLPKQQSTSFWSLGILGVKLCLFKPSFLVWVLKIYTNPLLGGKNLLKDKTLLIFFLKNNYYWPINIIFAQKK